MRLVPIAHQILWLFFIDSKRDFVSKFDYKYKQCKNVLSIYILNDYLYTDYKTHVFLNLAS